MANELPLQSARQAEVAGERVSRLSIALTAAAIALRPTHIIVAIASPLVRRLPVVSRTAAERPRILVTSLARPEVRLPPVVVARIKIEDAALR